LTSLATIIVTRNILCHGITPGRTWETSAVISSAQCGRGGGGRLAWRYLSTEVCWHDTSSYSHIRMNGASARSYATINKPSCVQTFCDGLRFVTKTCVTRLYKTVWHHARRKIASLLETSKNAKALRYGVGQKRLNAGNVTSSVWRRTWRYRMLHPYKVFNTCRADIMMRSETITLLLRD
jgi:hypothetical protein